MNLNDFKDKALGQFTREITDIFFCYIENDRKLMHDYLRAIGRDSNLDTTNRALGAAVKERFNLENGDENSKPRSKLIESYTEHYREGHR